MPETGSESIVSTPPILDRARSNPPRSNPPRSNPSWSNPSWSNRIASHRAWSLLLGLGLPLLAIAWLGQDSNWDLHNYHLYGPHAWLHGRLSLDIAPAQLQSWHNPLLDVPLYLMVRAGWHGILASLWLTLPMMLALYSVLRLHVRLGDGKVHIAGSLTLALMAISGAAVYAELGTSFNDVFVAAGVLAALCCVLRSDSRPDRLRFWCLAGVLAGTTAGLKLTASMYCFGLAGAALCVSPLSQSPRRLLALLVGGLLGLALTYGYWAWTLIHLHGNPFFPYFNQIFHSPDAPLLGNSDPRFKVATLRDALLAPVRLLGKTHRFSEMDIRDPRLFLGAIAFALLFWRARRTADSAAHSAANRLRLVAGFFFVSFLVWVFQFGVYRYVLALELLACLGMVLVLQRLARPWRNIAFAVAAVVVIGLTYPASWGRTAFTRPMVLVQMPTLPAHSLVVMSSALPLAYSLIALPDDVPAISIYNNFMRPDRCTAMQLRAERRIATHRGPLWLLRSADKQDDEGQQLAGQFYGLVAAAACQSVPTSFGELRLCPLRRETHPAVLCVVPAP